MSFAFENIVCTFGGGIWRTRPKALFVLLGGGIFTAAGAQNTAPNLFRQSKTLFARLGVAFGAPQALENIVCMFWAAV